MKRKGSIFTFFIVMLVFIMASSVYAQKFIRNTFNSPANADTQSVIGLATDTATDPVWTQSGDNIYPTGTSSKSNLKIGIGTTSPVNKLDVRGGMVIGSNSAGTRVAPFDGLLIDGNVGIGMGAPDAPLNDEAPLSVNTYLDKAYAEAIRLTNSALPPNGEAITFYNGASEAASIRGGRSMFESLNMLSFSIEGTERMRIDSTGNVTIDTAGQGIILKAPNGNCFRLTVGNSGFPRTTAVSCP